MNQSKSVKIIIGFSQLLLIIEMTVARCELANQSHYEMTKI